MKSYIIGFLSIISCLAYCQSVEIPITKDSNLLSENEVVYNKPELPDSLLLSGNQRIPHWYEIITNVPQNIFNLTTHSFGSENIKPWGYIVGSTAVLLATDKTTYHLIMKNYFHNSTYHKLADYSVWLGDGDINLGVAGLFSAYGLLFEDNKALGTGIQCAEAILSTGLSVQFLKRITGRESPACATNQSGKWRIFPNPDKYQKNQPKYYSFPSGHLSTAVTTLTVISENYPDNHFINPIGYSLIGMLGVGLVAKNMHWFSDFPLAYALGYGFGKVITSSNITIRSTRESFNNINITFMPIYINDRGAVDMLLSF
jgi:hypothetical protein